MNLNKLFPRLTIATKLAIAFALLALGPLAIAGAIVTRATVGHLRATAEATLVHDLELARTQTERALEQTEQDVAYLAALLAPLLDSPGESRWSETRGFVSGLLGQKRHLYQVKLVDATGNVLFRGRASSADTLAEPSEAEGAYYLWRARSTKPGRRLIIPVELRADTQLDPAARLPAIAILIPVWEAESLRGAVVGEARASALFAGLEVASPHMPSATGLVDSAGRYLYHSTRKRDWSSLLAMRAEANLRRDLPAEAAAAVLAGSGTLSLEDGRIVSYARLALDNPAIGPMTLYRALPLRVVQAPVNRYLRWVAVVGVSLLVLVLGLAVLAARQFTRPIYQIQQAARRLEREGAAEPLHVATNDELEDLATDFSAMAEALTAYRKRLEDLVQERTRALREKHAELADLLAHSADAIVGLDVNGRVRVWNRGAEDLFGYSAAEVLGREAAELLQSTTGEMTREQAWLTRELARKGAVANYQTTRRRKDGRQIAVSLTQTVIRSDDGQLLGSSLIVRDNTLHARLEEQLRRSERLAATSVMAAGLAHELNNPLAILTNRVECMERDARERCGECILDADLAVLRDHIARLRSLTEDLLRFADETPDEAGPIDLAEVARKVSALLERTFAARGLALEVFTDGAVPTMHGSANALETVCMNLLLNAADASPTGATVALRVCAARGAQAVELEVQDRGSGIPLELRGRIFEPFFTTKGPRGGTGLGLAVCRSIVERYHGQIRVDSGPTGSRFTVEFPATSFEAAWRIS
ncbi:MAG: PAS domain S-box protein [Gemmatimonadetes bacterium]|nr:PAS domain S-box protein [Gemmatimonadota bacterium]